MTDQDLLAQAAAHARAARITADDWVLRLRQPGYRYSTTEWYKALKALDQLRTTPVPPPAPSGLTLQRTIFFANVTDDAVQHACRLGKSWRHALTADPAYSPSVSQVNALKAASGGVDSWSNQNEISPVAARAFNEQWNLGKGIQQAETIQEFDTVFAAFCIGNPNAWTSAQRDRATVRISTGLLALTAECYNGQPDTYSSQGVPISSLTLGVAMDAGLRYPLPELLAKTPAAFRSTVCVWHGAGLEPADWDALKAL